jgi:hypothetical protein
MCSSDCEEAAAWFVIPGDDDWPGGLDDLRHAECIQRRSQPANPDTPDPPARFHHGVTDSTVCAFDATSTAARSVTQSNTCRPSLGDELLNSSIVHRGSPVPILLSSVALAWVGGAR